MNVIGVIPARYASTRLPGKPLKDIAGKPMIQHVYERALEADNLDSVIVATDDERIVAAVTAFGGRAVMTAADHPNGTSRVGEAIEGQECDLVINLQGDEPLVVPAMIDEVITALTEDPELPTATLCCRIDEEKYNDPNVVKTVRDRNGYALYFSRSLIPYPRHPEHQIVYEHIGIYGYRREFLPVYLSLPDTPLSQTESLEQLKVLENGYRMKVVETQAEYEALSIDTESDLERARVLIGKGGR